MWVFLLALCESSERISTMLHMSLIRKGIIKRRNQRRSTNTGEGRENCRINVMALENKKGIGIWKHPMWAEYMVWMKVNVQGYEDRDMAVGAMLWGITCTVKGKRTLLWRSWTGKKPEGAQGLVGYGLYSTFLCSHTHHNNKRERWHFYSMPWEALTHSFTHNKNVN